MMCAAMRMVLVASWVLALAMLTEATDERSVVLAWWAVMIATFTVLPVVYLAVEHSVARHAEALKRERKRFDEQLKIERRRTEALIQAVALRLAEDPETVARFRSR